MNWNIRASLSRHVSCIDWDNRVYCYSRSSCNNRDDVGSTKPTGLNVVTESVKVTGVIGVSEALGIAGGLDGIAA